MFRDSLATDAAHAMIYVNPAQPVVFQWRTSDGSLDLRRVLGRRRQRHGYGQAGPRRQRHSADSTAPTASRGRRSARRRRSSWATRIQAGLAVSSWNADALCTATFRDVTINGSTDFTTCPTVTSARRTPPDPTRTTGEFQVAGATDTVYTVAGCGTDIGGIPIRAISLPTEVSGDVTMIAQVDSMSDTGIQCQGRRDVPRQLRPPTPRTPCISSRPDKARLPMPRQHRRLVRTESRMPTAMTAGLGQADARRQRLQRVLQHGRSRLDTNRHDPDDRHGRHLSRRVWRSVP